MCETPDPSLLQIQTKRMFNQVFQIGYSFLLFYLRKTNHVEKLVRKLARLLRCIRIYRQCKDSHRFTTAILSSPCNTGPVMGIGTYIPIPIG